MVRELIKKIELQSVLVLAITLVVGYFLLSKDNSLKTPAGILGSVCIGFGILYTLISFFSNQIRESYKDLISEYKSHIGTLKISQQSIEKGYGKLSEIISNTPTGKQVGDYSTIENDEGETKSD